MQINTTWSASAHWNTSIYITAKYIWIFLCLLEHMALVQNMPDGGVCKCPGCLLLVWNLVVLHDDVIKWKHIPRYWPFVLGIHRSPVNSPHKGQWRGALMFSLIYVWISGWVNNREAGNLRRHLAHYDVTVIVDNNHDWTRSWIFPLAHLKVETMSR